MTSYQVNRYIVSAATSDVGIKEVGNNEGFSSPHFQEALERIGWKKGQSWCMYAVMKWWFYGFSQYNSLMINDLQALFSGLALKTWNNFKASDKFECNRIPKSGCIAIWQHYKNGEGTWQGHAAIVKSYTKDEIETIDGNTNKAGSREGQVVAIKRRQRNFNTYENGLVLKGFIHPSL